MAGRLAKIKKMTSSTVLSGMQPSGQLHIGNYLGALTNFVSLQRRYDCYFMIADQHSLTDNISPSDLRQQTLDLTAAYLAAGLNPKKSTIFLQSLVPEHTELAWILSTVTPVGELERMTQYKDKASRQLSNVNAGLLNYPILQAADILIYKPQAVPVGEDQDQHLEMTRTIARRFNKRYGHTFPEPKALYTKTPKVMSLTDPTKKMSKSIPSSCLYLTDSPEVMAAKLSRAVTDGGPISEGQMSPGVDNLFLLLKACGDQSAVKKFTAAYRDGSIRYSELKNKVAKDLARLLAPFRKKNEELKKSPSQLISVLKTGSKRARHKASQTMKEIRKKTGLIN